jgi:hypothetical protein
MATRFAGITGGGVSPVPPAPVDGPVAPVAADVPGLLLVRSLPLFLLSSFLPQDADNAMMRAIKQAGVDFFIFFPFLYLRITGIFFHRHLKTGWGNSLFPVSLKRREELPSQECPSACFAQAMHLFENFSKFVLDSES